MVCLKSPKSSEFAIFLTNSGQKSVTMFISSCFKNYFKNREIKTKKVEATEYLRNRIRKENGRKCL